MSKRRSLIALLLALVMPLPLASRASAAPVYIGSIFVGDKPRGVAVDPEAGEIYVPSESANAVWILDLVSHARLAVVGVGSEPRTVAVNPDTRRVYVSNHGSSTLSVVDAVSHLVVAVLPLARVWQFAIDRARNTIYAVTDQGHVTVIDGQANTISNLDIGSGGTSAISGVAYDDVRDRLYASQHESIYALDGATRQLIHGVRVAPGLSPGPLVVNTVTGRVSMVSYGSGQLFVVQEPEGFFYARTDLPFGMSGGPAAVDSETNRLYIPAGSNGIMVVNDTTVAARVGNYAADALAVDETRNRLYAAGTDYDAVAIFTEFIDTFVDTGPDTATNEQNPVFTFRASRAGATFECALDQPSFVSCTSGQAFGPLAEGAHTLSVRSIDTDGEPDPTPETRSFSVDLTPPDTAISAGPRDPTNSDAVSFSFTSEPGASFECALEGSPFSACTAPKGYGGLADGAHTFQVRARDRAGNLDPSAARDEFHVDTIPPSVTITSGPKDFDNSTNATFAFSSEPGSSFACALDTSAFEACVSPRTYVGLTEARHTFDVRVTDAAGNPSTGASSRAWTVDVSAPAPVIHHGPEGVVQSPDAAFGFGASEPATFDCRMDDAPYAACDSGIAYIGLPEGSHTFSVRATDRAGNVSPVPVRRSWRASYAPPETTISDAPGRYVASTDATFAFESEAGAAFTCTIDGDAGGDAGPCTSPLTVHGLPAGLHVFEVFATDPDGNADSSPAATEWTVDMTPPVVSIDSPSRGELILDGEVLATAPTPFAAVVGTMHVVVSADDAGSGVVPPHLFVDDEDRGPMIAAAPGRWEYGPRAEGLGPHTLRVVATNGAGAPRQASATVYSVSL